MKNRLLTYICVMSTVAFVTSITYACCQSPIASFTAPSSVCVDCVASFNASASSDPDGTQLTYSWSFGSGAYAFTGANTSTPTCKYSSAGVKTVTLTVTDNDNPDCCNSNPGCSDKSNSTNRTVTIVKVEKVVKAGTTNEGPLYPGCPGTPVSLEAKPSPAGASFPAGEPHWTIESQPTGASASLNPTYGSATTTLSGLNKWGNYVVRAKCGAFDTGDTITVTFALVNETGWLEYPDPGDQIPDNCSPYLCDGEDATLFDGCGNELEVSCAQADGTGGLSGCAFRYFYNDNLISSCIWVNGNNKWWYKEATIEGTNLKVFTKARHTTADPDLYDDEGCYDYYCSLVTIYDCLTGQTSTYWRRSMSGMPWTEADGEECPGH